LTETRELPERSLEEAVSRALRDNLAPLQRTANELEQAFGDFVAACSSAKPSNALPAMLRAQSSAASLAASLSVLSNFAAVALNYSSTSGTAAAAEPARQRSQNLAPAVAEQPAVSQRPPAAAPHSQELPLELEPQAYPAATEPLIATPMPMEPVPADPVAGQSGHTQEVELEPAPETLEAPADVATESVPAVASEPGFDVTSLPADIQDLHRRANRVAKVAMQDIKLLRPQDVQLGREHKDICERLRSDLDKARKEYDRRFRAIQDHPVDYFHRWMVEILAQGNAEALGEYPYPSPVLRH
jgi:hypothetical protein